MFYLALVGILPFCFVGIVAAIVTAVVLIIGIFIRTDKNE